MWHQVGTFLRLVWGEWSSRVTGSLSAILVLAGLGVSIAGAFGAKIPSDSIIQLATWILAAVCGGQAAYSVWAREHSRTVELEEKIRPKLRWHFSENDPGCFRQNVVITQDTVSFPGPTIQRTQTKCNYYRISVEADSVKNVPNCSGYLTSITKDGEQLFAGDNLILTFAPAERDNSDVQEIRNGLPSYMDVMAITEQNAVLITTKGFYRPSNVDWNKIFSENGVYVIKIVVSAPNIVSLICELELTWNGNWQTARVTGV